VRSGPKWRLAPGFLRVGPQAEATRGGGNHRRPACEPGPVYVPRLLVSFLGVGLGGGGLSIQPEPATTAHGARGRGGAPPECGSVVRPGALASRTQGSPFRAERMEGGGGVAVDGSRSLRRATPETMANGGSSLSPLGPEWAPARPRATGCDLETAVATHGAVLHSVSVPDLDLGGPELRAS